MRLLSGLQVSGTLLKERPAAPEKQSPGINDKPAYCCDNCPLAYKSSGFLADTVPENPLIAVVALHPGKQDLVDRVALAGHTGEFFRRHVLERAGVPLDRVIFASVLRCRPKYGYPTGSEKKRAEAACRKWDTARYEGIETVENTGRSLQDWGPDWYSVTFDAVQCSEVGAYQALAIADFQKALRFAAGGYRPVMFLGGEALEFAAPWLVGAGGIKAWRGHWWEGDWRWKTQTDEEAPVGFAAARTRWKKLPGKPERRNSPSREAKQQTLF